MSLIKYHPNTKTTVHIWKLIRESKENIESLVKRFNLSKTTISKWKHRENLTDKFLEKHK
ncbi:MAG TPA: hypothetical protein PLX23_11690 [Candidatus Hydrogenedens sp.]|nr:hypothetical protein [Candidatus Hydrogenedens sp.]